MIGQITASNCLNNSRHCARSRTRAPSSSTQSRWLCVDAAQPLGARGSCRRPTIRRPPACAPAIVLRCEECAEEPHQHPHIKPRRVRRSRAAAGCAARRSRPIWPGCRPASRSRREYPCPRGSTGSLSITSTRKSFSAVVTRRRQRELVADAVVQRVGSRDHVEQQRKIGGRARHRADHRQIAVERYRRQRRRGVAARRHDVVGRLVRIDAAMKRRHPQRAADVGAERKRRRSPPPAPPTIRRRSRRACGRDRRDCWWCRRSRCSSASRRARPARWSCRGSRRRRP